MAAAREPEQQPQEHPHGRIHLDPLTERLVPDPNNPNVTRQTGFLLGKSQIESRWRLYMSADLNHYVEFDKDDIIDAHQFRPSYTVVWLRPNAQAYETKTRSAPVEFLQGEIRKGFLRGMAGVPRMFSNMAVAAETGCGCPGPQCW
jgi:hypothetical protein